MEKEKFELQKRHTENIQELLEDTNVRLNKMEGEYVAQTRSTVRLLLRALSWWAVLFTSLSSRFPASRACRARQVCCGAKTPHLPSRHRLTRGSVWPLQWPQDFPWDRLLSLLFFFFFTPANVYKTFFLFFCFFSPLTFTLEIISLLFCFLFYLFVSVFLTEEVIVFLEMCNACGKTVRSGGGECGCNAHLKTLRSGGGAAWL